MEEAVRAIASCNDATPLNEIIMNNEHLDDALNVAFMKYIPYTPFLDSITDTMCKYGQKFPNLAIDLWTQLLVFENKYANSSALRSWLIHVVHLSNGALYSVEKKKIIAFLSACSTSIKAERRRTVAKKIFILQQSVSTSFNLQIPSIDDVLPEFVEYLDELALHHIQYSAKSLTCATRITQRWPPPSRPFDNPKAICRVKLLVCVYPDLFLNILRHWVGLKYISHIEFNNVLRYSPCFEDIIMTVARHPNIQRFQCGIDLMRKACSSGDDSALVSSEMVHFYSSWTSPSPLSNSVLEMLLSEFTDALAHCPMYAMEPVLLGLWSLILHIGDVCPGNAPSYLQKFFTSIMPIHFRYEPVKIFGVLTLVIESNMGSWPLWLEIPSTLGSILTFLCKMHSDIIDNVQATWCVSMLLKHFVSLSPSDLHESIKQILPPDIAIIVQKRHD